MIQKINNFLFKLFIMYIIMYESLAFSKNFVGETVVGEMGGYPPSPEIKLNAKYFHGLF